LLTVLAKLQKTEKPSPEKSCGVGVLFWRVMRHAKKTKSKPPKKIAKPKKAAALSKAQSPFKTGKIGNKECVLGIDPRRVVAILGGLDEAYPNATCELKHKNAFQLLISTILSAQTTDVRVNQVTATLYKKYPNPEAFAYATPHELEQELRPTGFFRNKTKSVMGASKAIVEEFGGQVPRTMEEILTLPGVARKTANVVLGTAYGIAAGVVVDTHVMRLSRRLDLSRLTEPPKIEQNLIAAIPQNKWIQFSHQLIWHGRRVCVARKPRCVDCNLEKICYSVDKTMSTHPDSPCLPQSYLRPDTPAVTAP
jgi:endonuclease-3